MTREDAKAFMRKAWRETTKGSYAEEAYEMAIIALEQPTIEPQTGKWVESDTDGFVCSVCRNGYRCQPTLMGKPMFEYCPVCGAKMEVEE